MNRVILTIEEARQLGGAIQRLNELGNSKILIPTHEAEQKGLRDYITRITSAHADELLACWFAIHNEYEPLIESFASLLMRAQRTIEARYRAANPPESEPGQGQAQQEATAATPANVVPLTPTPASEK